MAQSIDRARPIGEWLQRRNEPDRAAGARTGRAHRCGRAAHLADPRRQGRRQCPGAHHRRRARLAVRHQGARVPGALRRRQTAFSRLALSPRSGSLRSARAALARSDPDRRAPPVDGGAVGQGADARPRHAGRGRPAQTRARPLRSGDRAAAVPAAAPRQRAAPRSAADARRRGRDRRRQGGMARPPGRPAAAAHRPARGRADQAVPVRSGGRQAADGARPTRRRSRAWLALRQHQPPHAGRGGGGHRRGAARRRASLPWHGGGDNPYHALLGSPTASSSPATASR